MIRLPQFLSAPALELSLAFFSFEDARVPRPLTTIRRKSKPHIRKSDLGKGGASGVRIPMS
jgi:hypothetical protein